VFLLNIRIGLGYRNYMYFIIYLCLTKNRPINIIYWDTSCNTLFIDRSWLKKILLGNKIRIITIALIIKNIKSNSYNISKYIILNLRVPGYNQESIEPIKIILRHEFYIINKFPANILISIDIIVL
jgi:predicted transcriptional regulator